MIAVFTTGAPAALPARSQAERLTRDQIRRRRHADWLADHETGRYDPTTGRTTPRPIRLIASLAGVPERTVRAGIAEARRLRDAIRRATA